MLTERMPRCCRLRPDVVAYLLAHHRAHLDVVPARDGRWRLTPRGHAGVIGAPGLRLVLRPKIPLENLFFLLDPTTPVPAAADHFTADAGDEVLDFLAGQFAARLTALAAGGLHHGYRERQQEGPFLVGHLDVAAQVRQSPPRPDRLHCRHDEFTADLPCNQALKAVAELVLASPLTGGAVWAALRAAVAAMPGVQAVLPVAAEWDRLRQQRTTGDYAILLDLGGLLLRGLMPTTDAGATPGPAFLIDMEHAWERHVSRAVCGAFAHGPCTAAVQAVQAVGRAGAAGAVLMRPDLTVVRDGRVRLVVDAKWKRVRGGTPQAEDLYQVLAYCTALGAPRAVLVYPGRRDGAREIVLAHTPIRVTARALRVRGPRTDCARSARRLGCWLRHLAG
jgi:5-methylcytosine-specific restriction enzyme subunit McrC